MRRFARAAFWCGLISLGAILIIGSAVASHAVRREAFIRKKQSEGKWDAEARRQVGEL
jgi:hypothetical protein